MPAEFPLHCGPVRAAMTQPQCYLGESVERLMLTVEGRGTPGDISAISRLRRELHLGGVDPGDMEHERPRAAIRCRQHQPQRAARPQVQTLGQGEGDIEVTGAARIGEAPGQDLPLPDGARDRVAGGNEELDHARGHVEVLDHGSVGGLRDPRHGRGRQAGEALEIRVCEDERIGSPAPVEKPGVGGAGSQRPRRSRHDAAGEHAGDQRERQPGPPAAPGFRAQEHPDRDHRMTPPGPRTHLTVRATSHTNLISRFQRHMEGRSMMQAPSPRWCCPHKHSS